MNNKEIIETNGSTLEPRDNLVTFPVRKRMNRMGLEKYLRKLETHLPFLRKHIREVVESPDKFHKTQVQNSLTVLNECMDYLRYYLKDI